MREKEYNRLEDRWLHERLFRYNRERCLEYHSMLWWQKMGYPDRAFIRAKWFADSQSRYEQTKCELEALQRTK